MLSHLEITNYRGFKQYRMDGLAQVNLLVGKNNSGKTAILEGLQLLTSRGDPGVLEDTARRRGEIVISGPNQPPLIDVCHFFHGHQISAESQFAFSGDDGYDPVKVSIKPRSKAEKEATRAGLVLWITTHSQQGSPHKEPDKEIEVPRFAIERDGGVDFDTGPRFRRALGRKTKTPQVLFVSPESLNSIEMARMWDYITVNRQDADVASALGILESEVESVNFLTAMFASGFFPGRGGIVVGLKGQDSRLPLGSMGDGMRRMLALATGLACTKEGCLFVDEIDTGLHYSVMTDMWKLVITKAVQSGTQVFATTHSWDCIEGLSLLCQSDSALLDNVAIHQINRQIPRSIAFSGNSIFKMVKADIDPRG